MFALLENRLHTPRAYHFLPYDPEQHLSVLIGKGHAACPKRLCQRKEELTELDLRVAEDKEHDVLISGDCTCLLLTIPWIFPL